MKSYTLFQQYIWLVNTIHRAKKITFEEINRKWVETYMSDGLPMARSTFNRHKDAIEDMFGIIIECDKHDWFKYRIANSEVLEESSIQNWMLNTMSVSGMLNDSKAVHDRILLESVPSNGEYLHRFIEAMKSDHRVLVEYHKYGSEESTTRIVEPYCVKLFNRRWYALVRHIEKDALFTLSFDRLQNLEITDERFTVEEDFDAEVFFKDSYGIVMSDRIDLTTVRIRAYGREAFYMRDLPLHHSQEEIETTPEYSDFVLKLRPTPDFYTPLLARGPQIEVLEPQFVADEIKRLHREAYERYIK